MKKYLVETGFYNKMADAHISYENSELFDTYEEAEDYYDSIRLNSEKEFPEYKCINETDVDEDGEMYGFLKELQYECTFER